MQAVCEEHVGGGSFVGSGDDSQGPLLPISVGIEVNFGFMKKLIPRFSALPIRKSLTLTTTADFQLVGMVKVYAGERPRAKDNILLLHGSYVGISNARCGKPIVVVDVEIDVEGKISATMREEGIIGGMTNRAELKLGPVQLNFAELTKIAQKMLKFGKSDSKEWERIDKYWKFSDWCQDLRDMFEVRLVKRLENDRDMPHIMNKLNWALEWLKGASEASTKNITERRFELEDVVMPKIRYLLNARIVDGWGNEIPVNGQRVVEVVSDDLRSEEEEASKFMFFETPVPSGPQDSMNHSHFEDNSLHIGPDSLEYPVPTFTFSTSDLDVEIFDGKPSIELKYVVPPFSSASDTKVVVKQDDHSIGVDGSFGKECESEFLLVPLDPDAVYV